MTNYEEKVSLLNREIKHGLNWLKDKEPGSEEYTAGTEVIEKLQKMLSDIQAKEDEAKLEAKAAEEADKADKAMRAQRKKDWMNFSIDVAKIVVPVMGVGALFFIGLAFEREASWTIKSANFIGSLLRLVK